MPASGLAAVAPPSAWVTLSEHKWVNFRGRRGTSPSIRPADHWRHIQRRAVWPFANRVLSFLDGLEKVALEGDAPNSDEVAELSRCIEVTNLSHPTYRAVIAPDFDFLSKTDLLALDNIVAEHGHKSFDELKDLTHGMRAYTDAWRPNRLQKNFPMPFEYFFADALDKASFLEELEEDQLIMRKFSHPIESPKGVLV